MCDRVKGSASGASDPGPGPLVLVVNPDAQMRRILRAFLASRGLRSGEALTLAEALAICGQCRPAALLLDLRVGDADAVEFTRHLRTRCSARVLVLGDRGDHDAIAGALDAGADDYLVKPFTAEQLGGRLRLLLGYAANEGCIRIGALVVDVEQRAVTMGTRPLTLSGDELQLLVELARRRGHVLTYAQLARRLWGAPTARRPDEVRSVMARLRRKLEADPARPRFLLPETGIGYRLVSGCDDGGCGDVASPALPVGSW
jgi:two-component system KDP operon response regulator KdpE